jgi:hypothetical protein
VRRGRRGKLPIWGEVGREESALKMLLYACEGSVSLWRKKYEEGDGLSGLGDGIRETGEMKVGERVSYWHLWLL